MGNAFRGIEMEKACAAKIKSDGLISFRSAGSRGPFDVIGISGDTIRLIQVKRTSVKSRLFLKKDCMAVASINIPSTLKVVKELWCYLDGDGFYVREFPNDNNDKAQP
jgi:hypothetical protein